MLYIVKTQFNLEINDVPILCGNVTYCINIRNDLYVFTTEFIFARDCSFGTY